MLPKRNPQSMFRVSLAEEHSLQERQRTKTAAQRRRRSTMPEVTPMALTDPARPGAASSRAQQRLLQGNASQGVYSPPYSSGLRAPDC